MPNLLDFKDTKNIIIYMFAILLTLATYVYAGDQADIKSENKDLKADIKSRDEQLVKLITDNQVSLKSMLNRHYYSLRDEVIEIKKEQKEMRVEGKTVLIDIATLKALSTLEAR